MPEKRQNTTALGVILNYYKTKIQIGILMASFFLKIYWRKEISQNKKNDRKQRS